MKSQRGLYWPPGPVTKGSAVPQEEAPRLGAGEQAMAEVKGYHAHVYYDAATRSVAERLPDDEYAL